MAKKNPILLVAVPKDDVLGNFIKNLPDGGNLIPTMTKAAPIKFEDAIKKMVKGVVVVEKPKKKTKNGPVIKKKPKPKKKVKKVVDTTPLRPSPLRVGDKVWAEIDGKWQPVEIILARRPVRAKGEIVWIYKVSNQDEDFTEDKLIPDKIFTLNANDVAYMKEADFADALNETFDEKVVILAVYRKGQKRPWAYYVIPNKDIYLKTQKYNYKAYAGFHEQETTGIVYIKPAEQMTLRLIPISSAPQEILTYLGLHIYNRKWVKIHGTDSNETKTLVGTGSTGA